MASVPNANDDRYIKHNIFRKRNEYRENGHEQLPEKRPSLNADNNGNATMKNKKQAASDTNPYSEFKYVMAIAGFMVIVAWYLFIAYFISETSGHTPTGPNAMPQEGVWIITSYFVAGSISFLSGLIAIATSSQRKSVLFVSGVINIVLSSAPIVVVQFAVALKQSTF